MVYCVDKNADLAVFDTITGYWYVWSEVKGKALVRAQNWGWPGANVLHGKPGHCGKRRSNEMRKAFLAISRLIIIFGILCCWSTYAQQYPASEQAVKCKSCNGTGKDTFGKPCPWCKNTGTQWQNPSVTPRQGTAPEQAVKCSMCNGTGKDTFGKPCPWCNSTGTRWRNPAITPPQGTASEQAVKCSTCGGTGKDTFGKPCPWCKSTGKKWVTPTK